MSKARIGTYAFYIIAFALIITITVVAGYFYYANYEKHFRKELEKTLSAIAELKASQISLWRKERKGDAEAVFNNPVLKSEIKDYIHDPLNSKINETFFEYLKKFKEYYGYERVCFFDKNGVEKISSGGKFPLSSTVLSRFSEAIATHEISIIDLYISEYDGKPYLGAILPLFDEGPAGEILGAMILNVDPYNVLYPFIEKWPSPTKSAETIIVRREGDYAVFLNELKFQKNTALKLKIPLTQREAPAVKAVLGETGVSEGIDYRGVKVIAETRSIKDSPWFLVTRIDLDEVYGPLRERFFIMVFFMGIILLVAALGVSILWSRRDADFYMKQLESERENAWLQDIIEKSLNEIFVFSAETLKFKYLNTGARRNLGYSMHELYGLTAYNIKPEFTEETFKAAIAPLVKKEKQVLVFETVHKRKDGSLYDVEVHLQLIERENESLFLAVINDITERKKIEKAVLKNEQQYRLLFKNMTSGFALHEIILDDNKKPCDYRFIEVNDAFETLTGARSSELIGNTVKTIMPATEDYWIETYGKVALTGEAVRFENFSAAIGKYFEILAYSPEPGKFATIFQDITERKAIEKQIRELNDSLEKKVAERTVQLESSNKELEAFAYSVSHDLRAPLRAIDGFSRFLAEDYGDKLDAEGNRLIKVVRDNTQKMDQLISDLLSLSRITRSEMSLAIIDMKKMAQLVYTEALSQSPDASYEFICGQIPEAQGDPNLIRQVWHNLISNAVKYTSKSPVKKIEIGGYRQSEELIFFVKDSGVGFNADYVNKLFGVFQRLHKSEEFEGNGVGLAIVQRIIHRHGGRVWAEGKINEGAVFYFTLPVKEN